MDLLILVTDEDAVAPVIGIILLVAIVVILASIIGAFALGLQDETQDNSPSVRLSFEYSESETGDCTTFTDTGTTGKLTITHEAGDKIDEPQLKINDDGGNSAGWNDCRTGTVAEVTSGAQTYPEIDSSDTIRVVWRGENQGDDTATLGKFEGPEA